MTRTLRTALGSILSASLVALGFAGPAQAGCGCDHPPPAWAPVMPPFGSPGREVWIFADGASLAVGQAYQVEFRGAVTLAVTTLAAHDDHLAVAVPAGLPPGPVELAVSGPGYAHVYPRELFTALAPAPVLDDETSASRDTAFAAAVAEDGTLLVPVNLEAVLDPMQFALRFLDLPLEFGPDDVVFFNADGVDLTLFTLDVDDASRRQWGSYHGWKVEDDSGLFGDVYDHKVLPSGIGGTKSNLLTYWRHEFHTYLEHHESGGSHQVDEAGRHPDGTLHVDHAHLVLAIRGLRRDPTRPDNDNFLAPLAPGSVQVDLVLMQLVSAQPVEAADMEAALQAEDGFRSFAYGN